MVSHQMMPQDHYPEQALPSVSSTIHQQPSSTLEEERLASYDSVNYSNVSSVPHGEHFCVTFVVPWHLKFHFCWIPTVKT